MKYRFLFLFLIPSLLLLSGCEFDEVFESSQAHDGDDINVLQDVWPQALDKVFGAREDSVAQITIPSGSSSMKKVQVSSTPGSIPSQSQESLPSLSQETLMPADEIIQPVNPEPSYTQYDRYEEDDDEYEYDD